RSTRGSAARRCAAGSAPTARGRAGGETTQARSSAAFEQPPQSVCRVVPVEERECARGVAPPIVVVLAIQLRLPPVGGVDEEAVDLNVGELGRVESPPLRRLSRERIGEARRRPGELPDEPGLLAQFAQGCLGGRLALLALTGDRVPVARGAAPVADED